MTIIAEIGINHGGDFETARKMVAYAKLAGADIAKFQLYRPAELLGVDSPYFEEATKAQFSFLQHKLLKEYCESNGIEYGLSVFHADMVAFCEDIDLHRYKIGSRGAMDIALLREIAATNKPVILSTGLIDSKGIRLALDTLRDNDVTLLYCVCEYPTPLKNINLFALEDLKLYGRKIGFSSHCPNIGPSIAAYMRGATTLENHVVLDRNQKGCDVAASLDFQKFAELVRNVREMEEMDARITAGV